MEDIEKLAIAQRLRLTPKEIQDHIDAKALERMEALALDAYEQEVKRKELKRDVGP